MRANNPIDFFKKVKIDKNGCWIWQGAKNEKGYGRFSVRCKFYFAHRYSWMLFNHDVDSSVFIMHKCDNPPCVNPDHLFTGDNNANVADKMKKGRHHSQKQLKCLRGHRRIPENCKIYGKGRNKKVCLICEGIRYINKRSRRGLFVSEDYKKRIRSKEIAEFAAQELAQIQCNHTTQESR